MQNLNRNLIVLLISVIGMLFIVSCAGARGTLRFDTLKYPASMSPSLYNQRGAIVSAGKGLRILHHWKMEKTFWGIGYSHIELTGDDDVNDSINQIIQEKGGTGMVNVEITTEGCWFNYIPVLNLIPFYPGCTEVTVQGDVVR